MSVHLLLELICVLCYSLVDIKLDGDGGIPVEPFLEACKNLLPIFGKKIPITSAVKLV